METTKLPHAASSLAGEMHGPRHEFDIASAPHPHRQHRWSRINNILANSAIKKASKSKETPLGSVFVHDLTPYVENLRPIPPCDLHSLSTVLTWAMISFGLTLIDYDDVDEAKQLHLIAPILWAVVHHVPSVKVRINEGLIGSRVRVYSHFDFVLERGKKRVCVMQVKEEQFNLGVSQALLGCEVMADLGQQHEVSAVVTNFEQWIFLKSLNETVLCDEFNALMFNMNGSPDPNQLSQVTGKLYALLASDSP